MGEGWRGASQFDVDPTGHIAPGSGKTDPRETTSPGQVQVLLFGLGPSFSAPDTEHLNPNHQHYTINH